MNGFEKTSSELKAWLGSNSIINSLLSLDIVVMFAALGVIFLDTFIGGMFIGILGSIAFYVFLFGLLLCFANRKLNFMYIGLFGYAACKLIFFVYYTLWFIFTFHHFTLYYGSFIDIAVFALLGLLVFMQTGDFKKLFGSISSSSSSSPSPSAAVSAPSEKQDQ